MITAKDITRVQTAVSSQQAGNNVIGQIMFKGGFACTTGGGVLGPVVGPFNVQPGSAYGEPAGVYRVYLQKPSAAAPTSGPYAGNPQGQQYVPYTSGQIQSIDFFNVSGFTPRNPGATETASALVTGYGTDSSNGEFYITVQISTLTTGAILGTPPSNFVVGLDVAVTFASNTNPL